MDSQLRVLVTGFDPFYVGGLKVIQNAVTYLDDLGRWRTFDPVIMDWLATDPERQDGPRMERTMIELEESRLTGVAIAFQIDEGPVVIPDTDFRLNLHLYHRERDGASAGAATLESPNRPGPPYAVHDGGEWRYIDRPDVKLEWPGHTLCVAPAVFFDGPGVWLADSELRSGPRGRLSPLASP
jgi:hypothetical protein